MPVITQALQRLRRRFTAQSFYEKLAICALAASGLFVLALALQTLLGITLVHAPFVVILSSGTLLAALLWTGATRLSLPATAARIDALAATRDRFSTALAFMKNAPTHPMQTAALAECTQFIAAFEARPFIHWRWPREVPWLLVPLIATALLFWHAQLAQETPADNSRDRQELAEKADALEKLVKQIDAAPAPAQSEEWKQIAAEMRKSIARWRDPAAAKSDANKTALSELSSWQDALEKISAGQAPKSDLAALADALQKSNVTKAAADSVRSGDLRAAADALEKLLNQAAQIAAAMPPARESPSALAQAMSELSRAAGSPDRAQQALRNLADTLRRNAGSSEPSGAARQNLQAALSALQELKFGNSRNSSGTPESAPVDQADAPTPGHGLVVTQSTAANPGAPPAGENASRADERGTTKTPWGTEQKRSAEAPAALDLAGALGDGGSLQKLITTHGDAAKSAQHYRQLYDAMAPAAADAVLQEDIPLGSRFFVKRYFESIRPPE